MMNILIQILKKKFVYLKILNMINLKEKKQKKH
jgi:hypothetical protein